MLRKLLWFHYMPKTDGYLKVGKNKIFSHIFENIWSMNESDIYVFLSVIKTIFLIFWWKTWDFNSTFASQEQESNLYSSLSFNCAEEWSEHYSLGLRLLFKYSCLHLCSSSFILISNIFLLNIFEYLLLPYFFTLICSKSFFHSDMF